MTRQGIPLLIAKTTSLLAGVAAIAVLVGWHSGSNTMVGLGLSPVAMHYNNALAVLFCSLSLWCYATQHRLAARLLAIPVALIGAVHLLQFLLKARWGVDFWFHHIIADTSFTTTLNLAPTAAVSLYLLGVVQLALTHRVSAELFRDRLLRDVGFSVLAIAGIAWWAITDQSSTYGWGNLARMAPSSIVVFGLLALAFIALPRSPEPAQIRLRPLQVFARLLVPIVIPSAIILWVELDRSEALHIRETIQRQTLMAENGLQHSLESQAYSLRRMAVRLGRQVSPDLESWRADARSYLNDHPGLIAIAYSDGLSDTPNWVLRDQAPDYFRNNTFSETLAEAVQTENKLAISVPNAIRDGSSQFVLVSPTTESGDNAGAIIAIFDGEALLKGVISAEFLRQLHVVVTLTDAHIFETTIERDVFYRYWAISDEMQLLGKRWQLTIWPRPHYYIAIRTNLQDLVLVAGLIIAGLLMYTSLLLKRMTVTTKSLALSQQRLSLLLENAGEGILGLDQQGCITFLNKAAEKITGFSASELLLNPLHNVLQHNRADGSHVPPEESNINHVLQDGGSHFERGEVFQRKNGRSYPVEYTCSAITDNRGQINGAVVLFRDISELVEIENKLKATNEELESFAYLASHDLKAPLRVISNASQWLAEDLADHLQDEDRENMQLLQSRVKRMDQLLEDLLNYSRIGRVTDDRFRDKINGATMMDNILALLSPPPHIKVSFSDSFSQVTVPRMPLQQMVYNLIANAIKHHDKEEGNITVTAEILEKDFVFSVTDNGPGIEAKYHKKIFEIFRTLKPRDQVEGSGIGLSVVQKYADIYGGRVEVSSTLGEGELFYDRLAQKSNKGYDSMTPENVNILLLEDDDGDAKAIQRALRKAKVANPITRAIDGVEALEILEGTNGRDKLPGPHMLLVDINMPRMDGIEFLTVMRSKPELKRCIAFVLTTSSRDEDVIAAYELNVAGYVLKDNAGNDFLNLIELLDCYWRVVKFPGDENY